MLSVPLALNVSTFDIQSAALMATLVKLAERDDADIARVVSEELAAKASIINRGPFRIVAAQTPACLLLAIGYKAQEDAVSGAAGADPTWFLSEELLKERFASPDWAAAAEHVRFYLKASWPVLVGGHGYGAAIAVSAALRAWAGKLGKPGLVYAFGPPRARDPADPAALELAQEANAQDQILTVINDDDLLARVPARLTHWGTVWWFDHAGARHDFGAAPAPRIASPSPAEIAAIRADAAAIVEAQAAVDADGPNGPLLSARETSLRGFISGYEAHALDSYVRVLRQAAQREVAREARSAASSETVRSPGQEVLGELFQAEIASASSRHILRRGEVHSPSPDAIGGGGAASERLFPVTLKLQFEGWSPPPGLTLQSRFGTFATGFATETQLKALYADAGVARVSLSRAGGMLDLAGALTQVKADDVSLADLFPADELERGEGALFGLIDTGIDILHDTFKDAGGNLRILCIWDQSGTGGATPKGVDPAFSQDYGRLYLKRDLDAVLAAGATQPIAPVLRDLAQGHGTHVASIGAGRGAGPVPRGVAPDCEIVAVIPKLDVDPGDPWSVGYSNSHIDALAFLKRAAAGGTAVLSDPRPIAINVSIGMNAGAHDGRSPLEAAFDSLTSLGTDRGVVIVKSAGNERAQGGHRSVDVPAGAHTEISWLSNGNFRSSDYFELWFDWRDDIDFALSVPDAVAGNPPSLAVTTANPVATGLLGGNRVAMRLERNHPDNGDHLLVIEAWPDAQPIHQGEWKLELTGQSIGSERGTVHMWVERTAARGVRFVRESEDFTLSVPGTAETVVTVAACDRQARPGALAFSSYGPTRTEGAKPDVAAPGDNICAAGAGGGAQGTAVMSGSSMACPIVTGAVVLAFAKQKREGRTLHNAVQIRKLLAKSTQSPSPRHNRGLGWGLIDIKSFLSKI